MVLAKGKAIREFDRSELNVFLQCAYFLFEIYDMYIIKIEDSERERERERDVTAKRENVTAWLFFFWWPSYYGRGDVPLLTHQLLIKMEKCILFLINFFFSSVLRLERLRRKSILLEQIPTLRCQCSTISF
jgi:hypothetical protein